MTRFFKVIIDVAGCLFAMIASSGVTAMFVYAALIYDWKLVSIISTVACVCYVLCLIVENMINKEDEV